MDRETKDSYIVTLVAKDNGIKQLQSEAKLYITVEDINDNAPIVQEPKSGKIHENMPKEVSRRFELAKLIISWLGLDWFQSLWVNCTKMKYSGVSIQ